jgi:hypothetical protein
MPPTVLSKNQWVFMERNLSGFWYVANDLTRISPNIIVLFHPLEYKIPHKMALKSGFFRTLIIFPLQQCFSLGQWPL